jgi:hypothetical protein
MARGKKTGGRQKGTPNKRTAQLRAQAAALPGDPGLCSRAPAPGSRPTACARDRTRGLPNPLGRIQRGSFAGTSATVTPSTRSAQRVSGNDRGCEERILVGPSGRGASGRVFDDLLGDVALAVDAG